jgi:hypothetical protein
MDDRPHYRFTLRQLLAVVTILCILLGLLWPAIHAVREVGRRSMCSLNMQQMGFALHNFHDVHRAFPPGMTGDNTNQYGWGTYLLPFLSGNTMYEDLQLAGVHLQRKGGMVRTANGVPASADQLIKELHVDTNAMGSTGTIVKEELWFFLCPSSRLPLHDNDGYAASHYCGNAGNAFADYSCGAFKGKQQNGVLLFANDNDWTEVVKMSDIVDGTSDTLMVGEVGISQDVGPHKTDDGNFPIWAGGNNDGGCSAWNMGSCLRLCDREFRLNRRDSRESNLSFGSAHPGGANLGLADASVRFFADDADPEVLHRLGSRNGENPHRGDEEGE